MSLFLDKVLLNGFAKDMKLTERLMFRHVVLQVAAEVDLEKITKVGDMISRSCAHL